jgi:hypothetical protein
MPWHPLKAPLYPADNIDVTSADEIEDRELMLNRFRRLVGELSRGEMKRNSFRAWEIELLLDFDACELPVRRRTEILRQYQRAVEKQMATEAGPPMKLSSFLVLRELRNRSNPS